LIRSISEYLARLFITDYQETSQLHVRARYGILQGWISIIVNLVLGSIKLFIALIIGSLSLLADAIHSLSDMATSFILIISFYWGRKPSDAEHPFGHGRIEQIGALVMAVLIGVTGLELIKSGIERIASPSEVQVNYTAIVILILTIIIKEILGRISTYYGIKIQSLALEADSWHHRTDAISSFLAIIAIVAAQTGIIMADGIGGIIIGIFIIYVGIDIIKQTGFQLLGTRASEELFNNVEKLAKGIEPVFAIHEMICHEYGSQKVISFHLEIPDYLTLSEAHSIAEKVEAIIYEEMQIHTTVHLDPVLPVIKYRDEIKGLMERFIEDDKNLKSFYNLRLIGDELQSTLVLAIETDQPVSDEEREKYHQELKSIISGSFPEIENVSINFRMPL
jgi:cation diffusion facilitator family transporter